MVFQNSHTLFRVDPRSVGIRQQGLMAGEYRLVPVVDVKRRSRLVSNDSDLDRFAAA